MRQNQFMRRASHNKKPRGPSLDGQARLGSDAANGATGIVQALNRIGSAPELHCFVIDAARRLLAPTRVLLVLDSQAGAQVAASRLPRGESAPSLLAAVLPWLNDARAQGAAALHIGPPGAAPTEQRCCIVAPLCGAQTVLGHLYCDVDGRFGRWGDAQRDAAALLAGQAAAALDKLQLVADFELRLAQRAAEADEVRQQEAAANEVLKLISRSAFDLGAVLQTLVETAVRLCGADKGAITRKRGEQFFRAETHGFSQEFMNYVRDLPVVVDRTSISGRALLERRAVHIPDVKADAEFTFTDAMRIDPFGTALGVPMLRDGETIGAIALVRNEARPFTERQIARLTAFAEQAVIAIENARLFNETKEALERQTATSEVLRVISAAVTDVEPVFDVIAERSARLMRAEYCAVFRLDGETIHLVSVFGINPEGLEASRRAFPMQANRGSLTGRAIVDAAVVNVADVLLDPEVSAQLKKTATQIGFRSALSVPMRHQNRIIGAITVQRSSVGVFEPKEEQLLETFADQAVIAIQNVQMFNETKESLERQSAVSDILRVISSSPSDVKPALDAVAERAARICEAHIVDIILREGETMRYVATFGDIGRPLGEAVPLDRTTVSGRSIVDRLPVHVRDLQSAEQDYPLGSKHARKYGHRTILAVPLIREEHALGTILVRRTDVRPFEDTHIALLRTFADQAAIAIENVRLFNETQEALERQTATANVLKAISRSTFDLRAVLDTLIGTAARLCHAGIGVIFKVEGDLCQAAGLFGATPALIEHLQAHPISLLDKSSVTSRAVAAGRAVQVEDTADTTQYGRGDVRQVGGYRTLMGVPILREGVAVGVLTLGRTEVRAFDDKEIELVTSFADQAAIAMENVRLFNETKEALERQTGTAEILKVIASSPQDVQPVFDAIAASSKRLIDGFSTTVFRIIDGVMHLVAFTPTTQAADAALRATFPRPIADFPPMAMVSDGEIAQIGDTESDTGVPPMLRDLARLRGYRAMLFTPLMRDSAVIGMISVTRVEPGPFAEHHIQLLKTFADQAVIAIENVRLFNETQVALQRQTASADILRVISSSPTDVSPVLDAIVGTSLRLLASSRASVLLREGDTLRVSATARAGQAEGWQAPPPIPIDAQHNFPSRVLVGKTTLNIADYLALDLPEHERAVQDRTGMRSAILLPLLRDNEAIGVLVVGRTEPGGYADDQIALLRSFADQAVIAIQNVRLFNETKEALEQQTASAEVLQVISNSMADAKPVFERILASTEELFDVDIMGVYLVGDDGMVHQAAMRGMYVDRLKPLFPVALAGSATQAAITLGHVVCFPDVLHGPDVPPVLRRLAQGLGVNYALAQAPMMWEGRGIGALNVARVDMRPFTKKESDLLETFARQAVIAIQNARLFNETQEALETQTATADVLKVISESPTDVQPVFDADCRTCEDAVRCDRQWGDALRRRMGAPGGVQGGLRGCRRSDAQRLPDAAERGSRSRPARSATGCRCRFTT